jgi:nicotinamidase/pyrazinamidase
MPGTTVNRERPRIDKDRAVLLVVDMQPDFLPGGALPVSGADAIVSPLSELMSSACFDLIVAAQDWHPHKHVSFASNHPGRMPMETIELYGHPQTLWPNHCIQGTHGAALHPNLPWERAVAVIRKATDPRIDSYSAFRNNWNAQGNRPPTGLTGYLKNRGVEDIFLCGVAGDFCIKWSAEDALQEGFRVHVIWDLCRSIDPSSDELVPRALRSRGADIISVRELMPSR